MRHRFGGTIVVALGGSIIHPNHIDTAFLRRFSRFLRARLRSGVRVVLVVGGGKLARRFQDAAQQAVRRGSPQAGRLLDDDKDWLGIHATRLNAHLIRTIFRDIADPVVLDARRKRRVLRYPVTVASGWRPGWSTDYVAAAIAADIGAKEFIVAGKPSHVYDKDDAKYVGAKPIGRLSWREYRKLIPAKWKPGLHAPVDPVAARFAALRKLAAIIVSGRDLKNFGRLLNGKDFAGTIIG